MWAFDCMRSPLFHHQLSLRSAPPTPESPSRLHFQNLRLFHGFRPLAIGSALSGSPFGVNMSTLQDSLYGTDRRFAPPSQRHTPLQHSRSPDALGACCSALWRLPRPDFHRIVDGDFKAHATAWLLEGMDRDSRLISADNDPKYLDVARRYLEADDHPPEADFRLHLAHLAQVAS